MHYSSYPLYIRSALADSSIQSSQKPTLQLMSVLKKAKSKFFYEQALENTDKQDRRH